AICPQDHTYEKVLANIEEVRSRQGRVIAIATEGDRRVRDLADTVLYVPSTHSLLTPLLTSIPLQLLAYHCAVLRGHDVDKPRNLAKSVTVE
ncbi:MAG TPA: SIS domain-containing protein, partial [Planctomycetaceae bacterium]|nr:SIS domain-containing protein [Planctomycetaceae bacterium]